MAKVDKKTLDKMVLYKDWLINQNYTSPPVSIMEFFTNREYIGNAFDGGKTLYKCWVPVLNDVFTDNELYIIVLTGGTSIGKTQIAYGGLAYVIYLHLLHRDPWKFYGTSDGGKLAVAFFNLTKSLSASKGFDILQNYLIKSPWFCEHGTVKGDESHRRVEFSRIEYVLASPESSGFSTVGHHIIGGVMDEVDSPNATANSQQKIIEAYNSTIIRLENRFVKGQKTLGRFFLVSSKQEKLSFLNTYIDSMKKSKKIYVADFPTWVAKPAENYCGRKFKVSCGDMYNVPRVIRDQSDLDLANSKGFRIIDVPVEYQELFDMDVIKSLRDIAGVSAEAVQKGRLITNSEVMKDCWDTTRENPISMSTIEIGKNDKVKLIDYVDLTKFTVNKSVPRYIHCDIAYSGDALGLSMACVHGAVEVRRPSPDGTFKTEKAFVAHVDFVMRIKARDGDHIPLHRIREFILDLRDKGFRIARYTADLKLASEDTFQLLENAGIATKYFSMDQPVNNYLTFRDIIDEGRFNCFKHDRLKLEIIYLEYDKTGKGKVDHPKYIKDVVYLSDGDIKEEVMEGAKDIADATAGACLNALEDSANHYDVASMQTILNKVKDQASGINGNETIKTMMTVSSNNEVIGTVNNSGINKFQDILKRLV